MRSLYLIAILVSFLLSFESAAAQDSAEQTVITTPLLQTETSWNGSDITYPASSSEEITAMHIEFAPGSETAWHRHPVSSLAYIIAGELEVVLKKTGERKVFRAGDAFVEVVNTWHAGTNVGTEPVKLVVFYIGEKGMQLTEIFEDAEE